MSEEDNSKQSQLVGALREGVAVIQMILFKELRASLQTRHSDSEQMTVSMLAGAITNELFGTANPEPKFIQFRQDNRAVIEQELLGLATQLPEMRRLVTDALRIQALCDNQEGIQDDNSLVVADKLGVLLKEREIPLPSTFMSMVREVGKEHELIIPPVPISAEDDQSLSH
jgi:hypothetical protein